MASTNKTTNYELSQFLGTDKPAWLSDYNTDMSKIDAGIHTAQTTASGADGKADSNATAIGTLANLTTTTKTNVVLAINEVDSHADAAQETASSALSTATSASESVGDIASYLNLNSFTTYSTNSQYQITQGGGTLNNASITVARNGEGTLCKIYGSILVENSTTGVSIIKLNVDTGLRPTERLTITGTGFTENIPQTSGLTGLTIYINTDGTLEFRSSTATGAGTKFIMRPLACLIFVKNFGDQPE